MMAPFPQNIGSNTIFSVFRLTSLKYFTLNITYDQMNVLFLYSYITKSIGATQPAVCIDFNRSV